MRWTEPELEVLKSLGNLRSPTQTQVTYNQIASRNGWEQRTVPAVRYYLNRWRRASEKVCPHCSKSFTNITAFCSRACATSRSVATNGKQSWEPDAVAHLELIAGTDRPHALTKRFNFEARKQGWAIRTETAIKVKLKKLKISWKADEDGWNCTELANYLGIDRDRVHHWCEMGHIKSQWADGHGKSKPANRRITQRWLVDFAKAMPHRLQGIDPAILTLLLPQAVVYQILITPIDLTGLKCQVKHVRTGKIYPSLAATHRAFPGDKSYLAARIKAGKPAYGETFALIGPDRPDYSHLAPQYKPVDLKARAAILRQQGLSRSAIADRLGISPKKLKHLLARPKTNAISQLSDSPPPERQLAGHSAYRSNLG